MRNLFGELPTVMSYGLSGSIGVLMFLASSLLLVGATPDVMASQAEPLTVYWLGPVSINGGGEPMQGGVYSLNCSTAQEGVVGIATGDTVTAAYGFWSAAMPAEVAEVPQITAAVSRKTHGNGVGDLDVDVLAPLGSYDVGVECRIGGPTKVIVTFDQPIQGQGGLDPSDVSLTGSGPNSGSVIGVSIVDAELTIEMSGTSNAARLTIGFQGIENASGQAVSDVLCLGALQGDSTGDGNVNIFDLVTVRNVLNQVVAVSNFRSDVTTDGSVNIFDLVTVRNNLNTNCNVPCP